MEEKLEQALKKKCFFFPDSSLLFSDLLFCWVWFVLPGGTAQCLGHPGETFFFLHSNDPLIPFPFTTNCENILQRLSWSLSLNKFFYSSVLKYSFARRFSQSHAASVHVLPWEWKGSRNAAWSSSSCHESSDMNIYHPCQCSIDQACIRSVLLFARSLACLFFLGHSCKISSYHSGFASSSHNSYRSFILHYFGNHVVRV